MGGRVNHPHVASHLDDREAREILAVFDTYPTDGPSLADPSSIVAAAQWLEGTLLGTVATTVAVIAVASVGFMALSGRVDLRRAVTTILGCFIIFGASSIVAGIQSAVRDNGDPQLPSPPIVSADVSLLATPPQRPAGYDPYAGAAVPRR